MFHARSFLFAALVVTAVEVRAADWQAPKDNVMTEKQLTTYLQVQKEVIDNARAAGKAIEGSQGGGAALALMLRNDEKFKASLASHGMSMDEYTWAGAQVWLAYSTVLVEDMKQKYQADVEQQKKTTQQKIAEHKSKLADYEKAQKDGRKVMSKEDRESAIASAKQDQQSALDEARQHADEAKQAHDEAAKADADAKAADAAAKNPPADVSADDRPGFIDQKKSEAQSARDAAKEARDKETEAKKVEAESRAKAAMAGKRAAQPDLAMTDEEKAGYKKQNEEQISTLQNDIKDTEQGLKLLDETGATLAKSFDRPDADKAPKQNVELLKKHRTEFEQAWGIKKEGAK